MFTQRKGYFLFLAMVVLLLGALVPVVAADSGKSSDGDGTFDVTVLHRINGKRLDLSKELPVNIEIWSDGELLTTLEGFEFRDSLRTELPEGEYEIRVFLVEAGGVEVESMRVGPVEIEEDSKVKLLAKLDRGTPVIKAKIR